MSISTPLTRDELDDVASVICDWIVRGTAEQESPRARLLRYHGSCLNSRALGELLLEAQPDWPDERSARAAQAWGPLITRVERGWEQRMLLFAAVMVQLQRARHQAATDWLGPVDEVPPALPADDPDTAGLDDLSDFELGPA